MSACYASLVVLLLLIARRSILIISDNASLLEGESSDSRTGSVAGSYAESMQEGWSQTSEYVCSYGAREDPVVMKIFKSPGKFV